MRVGEGSGSASTTAAVQLDRLTAAASDSTSAVERRGNLLCCRIKGSSFIRSWNLHSIYVANAQNKKPRAPLILTPERPVSRSVNGTSFS